MIIIRSVIILKCICEKWTNSGMGNKYVIVLTACINPGKMIHTSLTDVDIRRRQYEDALEFYLLQTDYPIVFVLFRSFSFFRINQDRSQDSRFE